jgi:hypothetical protein
MPRKRGPIPHLWPVPLPSDAATLLPEQRARLAPYQEGIEATEDAWRRTSYASDLECIAGRDTHPGQAGGALRPR